MQKQIKYLTATGSIGISTVGTGLTQTAVGRIVAWCTGTSLLDGYVKGIVTGASWKLSVEVKVLSTCFCCWNSYKCKLSKRWCL